MSKTFKRIALTIALVASLVVPSGMATAAPKPKQPPPPPPAQPVDLALTLTDSPDPYIGTVDMVDGYDDADVTYLANITNRSTSKATSVALDVDFRVGNLATSAFYVGRIISSQGTCTKSSSFGSYFYRDTVACALGEVAPGGRASVEIHVFTCGGWGLTPGRGSVKGAEPDPETSNNSAYQETLVEDSWAVCLAA